MITKHNDADALAVNLIGLCYALRGRCYTWAYEWDQWFKSRFGKWASAQQCAGRSLVKVRGPKTRSTARAYRTKPRKNEEGVES
jgi:hypothetical protein